MALTKRTYVDGQTVITAENLNAIQDEIINNLAPKSHAASGTTYGAASTTNYGHVKLSNTTPSMDGTAAIGSSTDVARANHVHPSDTSRVPTTRKINNKALSADITLGSTDITDDSDAGGSTVKESLNELKGSLTSLMNRINAPQQDSVATLAAAVSALASASVGVFSGKSAVGAALIGINESCFIIAKYISSSNTALYFASSASAVAFGSFSTANYTVNIYETTVNTTGTATDVYTGANCVITKSWNSVQISFVGDSTERTFDSYGWKTLATLPSGYRPSSAIQGFPVRMVNSSGNNIFRTGRITSGGVLSVYMSSEDVNVPLKGIMVFTTFII